MAGKRPRPDLRFELSHRDQARVCVGVDEVGRGCLAGPVVTAAVVLPVDARDWFSDLNDSKLIAPQERKRLATLVSQEALVQIAWATVEEIDQWNILHASMVAMRRCLWPFSGIAQTVLVDGHLSPFQPRYRCPEGQAEQWGFSHIETLVKGDQRSMSIAAASIVAKVYRDEWMAELDGLFPGYEFGAHKGYSTPAHYRALNVLGPCPLHRKSFEPIRSMICIPTQGEQKHDPPLNSAIDL